MAKGIVEWVNEGDRWYPVLTRKTDGGKTRACPFCGRGHLHGKGDGHRVNQCQPSIRKVHTLTDPDGCEVTCERGYIVKTVKPVSKREFPLTAP